MFPLWDFQYFQVNQVSSFLQFCLFYFDNYTIMNKSITEINGNAHAKIMRDMSQYLDTCKNKKQTCQCTGVLEYDKNEKDELKSWKFIYQCNDQNKYLKQF